MVELVGSTITRLTWSKPGLTKKYCRRRRFDLKKIINMTMMFWADPIQRVAQLTQLTRAKPNLFFSLKTLKR